MDDQTFLASVGHLLRDEVDVLASLNTFYHFPGTDINNSWLILFDNELCLTCEEFQHYSFLFTIRSFQVTFPLIMPLVQMSTVSPRQPLCCSISLSDAMSTSVMSRQLLFPLIRFTSLVAIVFNSGFRLIILNLTRYSVI